MDSKVDRLLNNAIVNISDEEIVENRNPVCNSVARFDDLPSYSYIFENFLLKNVPFILGSCATEHWRSRGDWVTADGNPNFKFLGDNFGNATVPVANCKQEKYSAQPKTEMMLSEYLQYWESYIEAGYPTAMENLYLKDWHFTRCFPKYKAYETPLYFTSDWLNEFWDTRSDVEDDYRFVYMGPKGTWTPFHADVFRSYSWSANVCGRKKWILYPPGQEENLKDKHGNLAYNVDSPDVTDPQKFPRYDHVTGRLEVYQEQGEIIYVPSGWHHQVHNVEDTISINHNWINGCNIDVCWQFLLRNLHDVQREIRDCLGMEGWNTQCQVILKASSGIDFLEFYDFICVVAASRFKAVRSWSTGKHAKTDSPKNFERKQENLNEKFEGVCSSDSKSIIVQGEEKKCGNSDVSNESCVEAGHGPNDCSFEHCKPNMQFQDGRYRPSSSKTSAFSGGANVTRHGGKKRSQKENGEFRMCFDKSNREDALDKNSILVLERCDQKFDDPNSEKVDMNSILAGTILERCESNEKAGSNDKFVEEKAGNCLVGDMNQVLFDMKRLAYVLSSMLESEHFSSLDFSECEISPVLLVKSLKDALSFSSCDQNTV